MLCHIILLQKCKKKTFFRNVIYIYIYLLFLKKKRILKVSSCIMAQIAYKPLTGFEVPNLPSGSRSLLRALLGFTTRRARRAPPREPGAAVGTGRGGPAGFPRAPPPARPGSPLPARQNHPHPRPRRTSGTRRRLAGAEPRGRRRLGGEGAAEKPQQAEAEPSGRRHLPGRRRGRAGGGPSRQGGPTAGL